MADEIDRGNEAAELFLEIARKEQAQKRIDTPKGVGMCLNCDEDLDDDRRWCDDGCRDDYRKRTWQNQQKPVADHDEG